MERQFGPQEFRLQVLFYGRRRVHVAHEHKDNPVDLPDRIGLVLEPTDQTAVRVGDDLHQGSVAHVDGEPVEPAGHRVFGVAFGPGGERRAAVRAAVGDGVHLAIDPFEQDPFPHDHFALAFPFLQFMSEQRGIPVVAQSQFRLQVIGIRLQAFARAVDIVFLFSDRNVSHEYRSPFRPDNSSMQKMRRETYLNDAMVASGTNHGKVYPYLY